MLIKNIIITKIVFSFLILLAIAIRNLKTNKILNILTRVFKESKINSA